MALAIIVLILTTAVYCHGVVLIDDSRMSFDRRQNDLDWPLPDNSDPGLLIMHGVHCFEQLLQQANAAENMTIMHHQHCKSVISKILQLLEKNRTYRVNEWICQSIRRDRKMRSSSDLFSYGGDCYFERDWFNCYLVSCQERNKRSNKNQTIISGWQNGIHAQLASRNMGNLLMKNWTDAQSLNWAERAYLQRWEGRSATALGAVGVYCRVKGDLDVIRETLNLESSWNKSDDR